MGETCEEQRQGGGADGPALATTVFPEGGPTGPGIGCGAVRGLALGVANVFAALLCRRGLLLRLPPAWWKNVLAMRVNKFATAQYVFREREERFLFFFGLLDDIAGAETLSRLPSGSFPHGCEGNTEENSQRCVAVARGGTVENRTRRKVGKGKQVVEKQATRTPTHPGAMRLGQQASSRPSQSHATPREISVSGLASWRNLFSVAGSEGGRSSYLMAPGGRCGTA